MTIKITEKQLEKMAAIVARIVMHEAVFSQKADSFSNQNEIEKLSSARYSWDMSSTEDGRVMYYAPVIDGVKGEKPFMDLPNQEACLSEAVINVLRSAKSTATKAVKKVGRFVDYLLLDADKREKAMAFFHKTLDKKRGKIIAAVMAAAYRTHIVIDNSYTWECVKTEFHTQCSTSGITKYYDKDRDKLLTDNMERLVFDMQIIMRKVVLGYKNPYLVKTKQ